MRIIGIDPGCDKSGVAIYENGELVGLKNLSFPELYYFLSNDPSTLLAIEDANLIKKSVFKKREGPKPKVQAKKGESVGKVKQLSRCIIDIAIILGYEVSSYRATGDNWAKKRQLFERITKWPRQSNHNTRSAAFFGFLESKKYSKKC